MFVRNGEKLGSIQVDPSSSDPQKRATKKGTPKKVEPPAGDETPKTEPDSTPDPEPDTEPEPKKAAPAKKADFRSALDKKG